MTSARLAGLVAALALVPAGASSGEVLLHAQRELRVRKIYFGPLDGKESAASTAAIRRFQQAKGIDQSGQLDDETLRLLGLANDNRMTLEEKACDFIQRYVAARSDGSLDRELEFFGEFVDHFSDGEVGRGFIRTTLQRERSRWPRRHCTLLNRVASPLPNRPTQVLVTARIRTEVHEHGAPRRAVIEDLDFVVREVAGSLRIVALKRNVAAR